MASDQSRTPAQQQQQGQRAAWTSTATIATGVTPLAYPTSLRTSLYANSPRSAAAPRSAHRLRDGTGTAGVGPRAATPRQQVKVTASPRVSLTLAHAQPRTTTAITTTTTTSLGRSSSGNPRRRGPRSSNPFDDLSAPAFDSFIDNLTSTLRSVLEPPPPPVPHSKLAERQHRERDRQERARQRDLAQRERDARHAPAAEANGVKPDQQAQQGGNDRDRDDVDVFGEVKKVAAANAGVDQDLQHRIPGGGVADLAGGGNELPLDPDPDASWSRPPMRADSMTARKSSVESDMIVLGSSSGEEEEDEVVNEQAIRDAYAGKDRSVDLGADAAKADAEDQQQRPRDAFQGAVETPADEDQEHVATSALLEMRQVDHHSDELVRPLFLQRATASVSTSEADADELFHPDDDRDADKEEEEEDELADEPDGEEDRVPPPLSSSFAFRQDGEPYPLGGEDVYDVDALGEGIEEEEKLEARLGPSSRDEGEDSLDPAARFAPGARGGSVDETMDAAHEDEQASEAEEEDEEEEDPSVFKDPFGRPIRYAHGFAEADGSDYEEEYVDGGNAMDPAEAEWAGRRSSRPVGGVEEAGNAASEEPEPELEQEQEQVSGDEVEVLELESDSDADSDAGSRTKASGSSDEDSPEYVEVEHDREREEEEEDEGPASLTAEMLGEPREVSPDVEVDVNGDTAVADRQRKEDEDLADIAIEVEEAEIEVLPAEEPMDVSNAPTPSLEDFAASADTFVELEVIPLPVPGEEEGIAAERAEPMDLASTATTPALETPVAVPNDHGSEGYCGVAREEDKAVDSGALADVDEDIVMREPEPDSTEPLQTGSADLLDAAPLEAVTNLEQRQVALPLQDEVPADVGLPEVDEANLADVEEEATVVEPVVKNEGVLNEPVAENGGAPALRPEPKSDADSLVVTEISGLARFDGGQEQEAQARTSPIGTDGDEAAAVGVDAELQEYAEMTTSATNPLEALYEHEDSEDSTNRIPYEAKGKGRAPMTPSDLDFEGEAEVGSESSTDSAEFDEGDIEDRIEFAISQWHSFSDQLRFYDRHELVEKVIELREQYERANQINSPWEVFVRIQLHDVETEFERRRAAGIDDTDSEEDENGMVVERGRADEAEQVQSQEGEENTDGEGSDVDGHALFLDEEYESDGEGEASDAERMRDDSGSPAPVDRSAFPDDSPSPPHEDDTFPAERDAAEAEISAIVDELVSMHESHPNSALRVSSSVLDEVDSPAQARSPDQTLEPYSGAASAEDLDEGGPDSFAAPPSALERQAPTADGPSAAPPSVGSTSYTAPLDPHHPFLRQSDARPVVHHAGNIEYEVARPGRSVSPPRFERVPAGHRVDSPVTVDGDDQDAQGETAYDEMIRVGVDEEEMTDSTLVGRMPPMRGAIDASREQVHEQVDLETAPADSLGLVIIDDDDDVEDHQPDVPTETTSVPQGPHRPAGSPRKRVGATPPPTFEPEDAEALIVAGVAPPVNFDILPDAPNHRPSTPEPPISVTSGACEDVQQPAETQSPVDASQTRSLKSGEAQPKLPSAMLNRGSAAQEATSDSRVPFQIPPTMHRLDSPLEEGELFEEDDEMVRVGVAAEEELDARLVEAAKPLARAIDASHVAHHEQVDVAVAAEDAGSAALTIVDDDADFATPITEPVEAVPGFASSQASLSPNIASHAPTEPLSRTEEATAFPYGVAPPQNPDIIPATTAALPVAADDAFNVADYVALGSDDGEDGSDAQSPATLPITGSSQAEYLPLNSSATADATGHQVLGLPAEDAASATYESPVVAIDSDEEEDHAAELVPGPDESENALEAEQPAESTDMSEHADRSSPLQISGVQEPGKWDPASPIRFGRVLQAESEGSATAAPGPNAAGGAQQPALVQVTLEVAIEGDNGDGDDANAESVGGSTMKADDTASRPDELGNHTPRTDVDDVYAHSREPDAKSVAGEGKKDEGLQAHPQLVEPAQPGGGAASLHAGDTDSVTAVDFVEDPDQHPTGSPADDEAVLRQYTPLSDDIQYTESDSDDDDEVLALLSPRKSTQAAGSSNASKTTKRATRIDAITQEGRTESPHVVRRSSRLSTTPAASPVPSPSKQAASSKRPRAERSAPSASAQATLAKRPRQSKVVRSASSTAAQEVAPFGVRQHRHRHHLPEVHGSDTDDGISPPVTRSHCHFERFKIASRADPEAAYLFNIPACALSSEVARDTIKAFEAEDLGPVDETDGCEGIQLGGVSPTDAAAIKVMASRHSNLVPHEDVLDAVRRIAGPELWDEGACEVVPREEIESAADRSWTKRKGKRRASEEASGSQQESTKKRR